MIDMKTTSRGTEVAQTTVKSQPDVKDACALSSSGGALISSSRRGGGGGGGGGVASPVIVVAEYTAKYAVLHLSK